MKNDILEEIDKLKMMVVMDQGFEKQSESSKFRDWTDKLLKKGRFWKDPFYGLLDTTDYAVYKTIQSMVIDLYQVEHEGERDYHEKKREINQRIADVVAMTLFYKEQVK